MKPDRMKRLSDENTEYTGSAKDVSSRIKNASAGLKDEKTPEKEKPVDANLEAVRKPGDPGVSAGEADAGGEEEVIEPPEPTRLTDQELAKHPDEYLQTISDEGEESETEDGTDADQADKGFQTDGTTKAASPSPDRSEEGDGKGKKVEPAPQDVPPDEEEVKRTMSAEKESK